MTDQITKNPSGGFSLEAGFAVLFGCLMLSVIVACAATVTAYAIILSIPGVADSAPEPFEPFVSEPENPFYPVTTSILSDGGSGDAQIFWEANSLIHMEADLIRVWDEYYSIGEPIYYGSTYRAEALSPFTLVAVDWGQQGAPSIAWDLASDTEIAELTDQTVHSVSAFSPYGDLVAVSAPDDIVVWHVYMDEVETLPYDSQYSVTSMAWSPDGGLLAVGTLGNTIYVWETIAWQQVATVDGPSAVQSLAFTADSSGLLSGHRDGEIMYWDAWTLAPINEFDAFHTQAVDTLDVSPDNRLAASGSRDGYVAVWDLAGGTVITSRNTGDPVSSVAWSPDSWRLAYITRHELTIWNTDN